MYLIKLRVEGLFYHSGFVLGLLLNIRLEVPKRERERVSVTASSSSATCPPAARNSNDFAKLISYGKPSGLSLDFLRRD